MRRATTKRLAVLINGVHPRARLLELFTRPIAPSALVAMEGQMLWQPVETLPGDDRRAAALEFARDLFHVSALGIIAGVAWHCDDHTGLVDGRMRNTVDDQPVMTFTDAAGGPRSPFQDQDRCA